MVLAGYYNEYGYYIFDIENNYELYSAGNSPWDSQQNVGIDDALPLNMVKDFCQSTLQEMAEELDANNAGIEYEDIEE